MSSLTRCLMLVSISCFLGLSSNTSLAQNHIADLFPVKDHDFGVVARAAKAEYTFQYTNKLQQPITISGASRSCGCVTPIIKTRTVQPGETGEIVAQFNSRSFVGDRSATITLSVTQPVFTQVQLHIRGYVRTDIVVDPEFVDFNNVVAGDEAERQIGLSYAGSPIWQIKEIKTSNPDIEAEFTETQRQGQRIKYNLKIRLKKDQEWGYLNEQVVIVTNDNQKRELPILVRGNIKAPIELPSFVNLGSISKGETVTKTLMVKAARAFTVTGIEGGNPRIRLTKPDEKNKFHMLKIEVDTTEPGTLEDTITIKTDVPNMPSAQVKLTGSVIDR